jgi:DNA-binding transcriptional LysR family regulator
MLPDSQEFDTMETHSDRLCLVVPKGHPLTNGDLSQLNREKFILVSEKESPILYMECMEFFRSRRFTPNVVNESDNVRAVLLSVSAGLGVTILPSSQPREIMSASLDVIPLDMDISYAVAWKKSLLNPAAKLFLEVLRQRAGE